jgi:Leucine-rich repeat (LRR) protein
MGNCFGSKKEGTYEPYGRSSNNAGGHKGQPSDDKMVSTWKQTGIVGLRDRGLKEIPASVEHVGADAKVLDATNNKISTIPDFLIHLNNLQRLVLSSNLIQDIPGSVLISLAPSLRILLLDSNQIEKLPDEIGSLWRLEKLSIKNNSLSRLNPNLGKCTALQFLTISQNKLGALPSEIGDCQSLEEIDASGNGLGDLTPSLGKLQKLKTLNVDNNSILKVHMLETYLMNQH